MCVTRSVRDDDEEEDEDEEDRRTRKDRAAAHHVEVREQHLAKTVAYRYVIG